MAQGASGKTIEQVLSDGMAGDGQELVAVALTMMTRYAMDSDPDEQAANARSVQDALKQLANHSELSPELRHLCQRLERIWASTLPNGARPQ